MSRLLPALRWLLRGLDRLAAAIIAFLLMAMVILVASQFVDRYVHPVWRGIPADEYVKVALIWMTFIGFALAMRSGTEIRVDLIDQRLPAKARLVISGFFDLLLLAMLALIVFESVRLYEFSTLQTILGTDMTLSVPVLGLLIGCAFMFIAVLTRFLRRSFGIDL